jgi:hypothetical protein
MPNSDTSRVRRVSTFLVAALALGALFTWPRPSRADLDFEGANTQQHTTLQSVFDSHVPTRFHTKQGIEVQIFSRQAMLDYIHQGEPADQSADQDEGDDTIDGIYEDAPPTITLRTSRNLDNLSFTFAHEYGHYVWEDLMTRQQHRAYAKIYYKERAAHHLVTTYAATELDEGFAESFSFYVMAPPILQKRDPLSYQFLCALQPDH